MASPSIESVERRTRKHRNVRQRQQVAALADQPDNPMSSAPVAIKETPADFVSDMRTMRRLATTTIPDRNGAAPLLGQNGILGQTTFDPSIIARARKAAEPEIENARRAILSRAVFDPTDPYQAQRMRAVFPWLAKSRQEVAEAQVEQFRFLTMMQNKTQIESEAEAVRIFMLLGGRERLIFMNHVAMAGALNPELGNVRLWEGIKNMFGRDRQERNGRFLMGGNDDEWFAAVADPDSDERKIMVNLAKTVVHLFPALTLGVLNPFADPGNGDRAWPNRVNFRTGNSKTAADLVAIAVQFCLTADPTEFLIGTLNDVGAVPTQPVFGPFNKSYALAAPNAQAAPAGAAVA